MSDKETDVDIFDPNMPFKLSSPITTHKGEVSVLEFKMPTARSFIKHGLPYKQGSAGVEFNIKAVMGFIADMTGVDTILLEELDGRDVYPLCFKVLRKLEYSPLNG